MCVLYVYSPTGSIVYLSYFHDRSIAEDHGHSWILKGYEIAVRSVSSFGD
jgi:hypothetical protein